MTILQANGNSSWWTEVPPMFETWELWQWGVASLILVVAWGAVSVGWAMFMLGNSWEVIVGPILGLVGTFTAFWTTVRLMRHMPEQRGSLLFGLALFVLAMVLWYLVFRVVEDTSWPVPVALVGGVFFALVVDAFNRHLASIPAAPIMLVLGVIIVGLIAFSAAEQR